MMDQPSTNHHKLSDYNSNDNEETGTATTDEGEKKLLVRNTPLRWLMLSFGCFFLMGSYFCYDNPAALKSRLVEPPFDFTDV